LQKMVVKSERELNSVLLFAVKMRQANHPIR